MSSQQHGSNTILVKENLVSDTVALIIGKGKIDPADKKLGIEVEMPFVKKNDLKPLEFSGKKSITSVFNALVKKGAWEADEISNGKITGLKGESGNISLEPGGQIEYAGAPRGSLAQIEKDIAAYFADIKSIGDSQGIDIVPFGFHPHLTIEETPFISERSRFAALKPVFEAEKGFAAWGQSSSVQLTLDGAAMEDAFGAFKLGLMLQPVAAAMFANSPFVKGEDSGFKSIRRENLLALDSPYYTAPDHLFDKDFTIQDWAAHVLTVPMSFVVRNDEYISVAPNQFGEMVGKKLPELAHLPEDQQYLTHKDLLDHTTGIKPEMLLKPNLLLEFRAADLGPSPQHWMALAAFWTGIFYEPEAFKAAQEYVSDWSNAERSAFRKSVAKDGLSATIEGKTAQQVALDLIEISKKGLQKIEPEAVKMLDILTEQVGQGVTPADLALAKFVENGGDMVQTLKQSLLLAPQQKAKGGPAATM
ncbi:MAG TPA: glutamate-cysteine ligase family protein [Patescibacteria group bacterium]|nr:glutamate-cysteine ligase family protein [Patescibacteria group bacterium]